MEPIRDAVRAVCQQIDALFERRHELADSTTPTLLDRSSTLLAGDLVVVGAATDDDAQRLLCNLALDVAPTRDVLLVVRDVRWTTVELLSILTGMDPSEMQLDRMSRAEVDALADAHRRLKQEPIQISDALVHGGDLVSVETWLGAHPGGVAVLPAAWLASSGGSEDAAAAFVRELKSLARATSGTVVVPWRVHASRRLDPCPQLPDLALSGACEDDADLVLLMHPTDSGLELHVAKNRHGPAGQVLPGSSRS